MPRFDLISSITSSITTSPQNRFLNSCVRPSKILPIFFLSHSFIKIYKIKIYISANIMKTQIFHIMKVRSHWRSHMVTFLRLNISQVFFCFFICDLPNVFFLILWKAIVSFFLEFTKKFSDFMVTLTYVLMDNVCPCFWYFYILIW